MWPKLMPPEVLPVGAKAKGAVGPGGERGESSGGVVMGGGVCQEMDQIVAE